MPPSSAATDPQDSGSANSETSERPLVSDRTNSLLGVQIISSGSYVPDLVVSNFIAHQSILENFGRQYLTMQKILISSL